MLIDQSDQIHLHMQYSVIRMMSLLSVLCSVTRREAKISLGLPHQKDERLLLAVSPPLFIETIVVPIFAVLAQGLILGT